MTRRALSLIEAMPESLVRTLARRTGLSPKKVREFLRSEAMRNPTAVIAAVRA